jgi:hypothetical protein
MTGKNSRRYYLETPGEIKKGIDSYQEPAFPSASRVFQTWYKALGT